MVLPNISYLVGCRVARKSNVSIDAHNLGNIRQGLIIDVVGTYEVVRRKLWYCFVGLDQLPCHVLDERAPVLLCGSEIGIVRCWAYQ